MPAHIAVCLWRFRGKKAEACCVGLGHMAKAHRPLCVGNVFVYYRVQCETHLRFKEKQYLLTCKCVHVR